MKKRTAAVVGLGYVGLPLALLARKCGWQVVGIDIDEKKVGQITVGQSPFADEAVSHDLKQPLPATTDFSAAANADVIVIAVPTPVTKENLPDLTALKRALTSLLPHLRGGQLLIVESTINPGVMDGVVLPILQERKDLPLEVDKQSVEPLYIVHCPERINPADKKWTVRNIPRVVGGYSEAGTSRAQEFYGSILDAPLKVMSTVTEAEAVKILENTFRDINIAFINEMAKSFAKLDIDIVHVIEGAATKPFAFLPHYPGNGVGGHCISVDPYYMIERARQVGFDHEFLRLARSINDSMPAYTVDLLKEGLKSRKTSLSKTTVALFGLAYKKNVADLRESPALKIRDLLEDSKTTLKVFDPFVPEQSTVADVTEALADSKAIVLACDHTELVQELTPDKLKQAGVQVVIDGKNALAADDIAAAGISYYGIGRLRPPAATKAASSKK